MLVALASVKGSPGVTSTALALAALWPRPVVLLEADPIGGDLAYRCRAAHGGSVSANRGLLRLAAAVRGGSPDADAVFNESQLLACGVNLVQGVSSSGQARGLRGLWPTIAGACTSAGVDVIADLGRLDPASAVMPMAQSAHHLLPVAATALESVMHLSDGLTEIVAALPPRSASRGLSHGPSDSTDHGSFPGVHHGPVSIAPILIGPDAHALRDCADLDDLLLRTGLPVTGTRAVPYDARALQRLERGERATRLSRTPLLRAVRTIASSLVNSMGCAGSEDPMGSRGPVGSEGSRGPVGSEGSTGSERVVENGARA